MYYRTPAAGEAATFAGSLPESLAGHVVPWRGDLAAASGGKPTAADVILFSTVPPGEWLATAVAEFDGSDFPTVFFPTDATPAHEIAFYRETPAPIAMAAAAIERHGVFAARGDVTSTLAAAADRIAAVCDREADSDCEADPLLVGPPLVVGATRDATLPGLGAGGEGDVSVGDAIDRLDPPAFVRAGLSLVRGDLDTAHAITQAHEGNPTADYLHAIVHRREGDYGNAAYWFRRAQRHPVLAKLAREGVATGEPFAFLDICRRHVDDGSPQERLAREAQWAELLALLTYTAGETV
ncbi:MAG: hypothetical protein AAGJ97_01945 [Planctomycetota bacterium]